jgi:hypothetical protein
VPLDKRPSDRVGTVAVTFRIPADAGATTAMLLGEFTGWSPVGMATTADGGHEVTVELAAGASYRFRYLLDDERWANDWEADDYVANQYGSDDSVVVLDDVDAPAPAPAPEKPKRAPRKSTSSRKATAQR